RAIQDLLDHKAKLVQLESSEYRSLQRHTMELTKNVETLQALTRRLGTEQQPVAPSGSAGAAPDSSEPSDPRSPKRMIPAVGKIILDWNQRDRLGELAREQIIQLGNSAMVVAPASGKVLLANPFKSYGNMLIIATRDGYLCVVAGVDRLVVTLGETVTVGQPIGGIEATAQNTKNILFQVLYQNRAIDPNQWVQSLAISR
ncbi:MAG: peptidoglycan DD-metalloendopeptidase family protein, partial [Alphaproteobacteria bacterium]|nr:peptidoglycan DD-metalloendopeptidase family protein [Alphaproteobacteria bacterium]